MASSKDHSPAGATRRATHLSLLVPLLLGGFLLITSTTDPIPGVYLYDGKRILQFLLLLLLLALPVLSPAVRRELGLRLGAVPRWMAWLLAFIFASGVLSAALNARSPLHLANSLSEVALFFCLLLGVFVVAACRRLGGRRFDQVTVILLALTAVAVGIQELLGIAAARAAGVPFNFDIALIHFSWPRFYNHFQSWTVPVVAALPLLFNRHRGVVLLCLGALSLHWFVILETGARGSILSISMAVVIASLVLPSTRFALLRWQVLGLAIGAALFLFAAASFNDQHPGAVTGNVAAPADESAQSSGEIQGKGFTDRLVGRSVTNPSGRGQFWTNAGRLALGQPLIGIGPMNYVCTIDEVAGHPHNFALQVAAEWGLPVTLALAALVAGAFWRTGRQLRPSRDLEHTYASFLFTGVVAAALHAMLSGVLVMPASQVTGLLVCGSLLGLMPLDRRKTPTVKPGPVFMAVLMSAGVLLASGLLAVGAWELKTMQSRAPLMDPTEPLRPRMWQDGRICTLYMPAGDVRN